MTAAFGEAFVSVVPISAIAGILFAIFLWRRVAQIQVRGGGALRSDNGREYLLEEEQRGEAEVSIDPLILFQFRHPSNLILGLSRLIAP